MVFTRANTWETIPAMLPAVLRNRPYARLWAAQSITQFGGQLSFIALPMVAYESTGSAAAFGAIMMASSAGIILTMLVGGALADRFDRQRMMLLSDGALFAINLGIGAAVLTERWWVVGVLSFLLTTVASLLRAGEALRRDLLSEDERIQAAALSHFSLNATNLGAPLAGIAIYAAWGFLPIIVIDLATTAISFVLLLGLRDPRDRSTTEALAFAGVARRVVSDVRDGVAVVAGDRWLRAQIPGNVASGFANGMFIVAIIPWLDVTLGLPASAFGVTIAVVGASGLLASMLVARLHGRLDPTTMIVVGGCVGTVAALTFVAPMPLAVIGIALVLFGVTNVVTNVGCSTIRQRRFDGDLQGRLGSLEMVSMQFTMLTGMGTASLLADRVDPAIPIAIFGIGVALACANEVLATRVLRRDPRMAADLTASDSDLAVSA